VAATGDIDVMGAETSMVSMPARKDGALFRASA